MTQRPPQPWHLVTSRLVFEHPRLCLREDTVILPSGRQTEWLCYVTQGDFVLVICLDPARRVLVARQYCHPPGRVVHEFPGGLVDAGESLADAARRELLEEVGWLAHRLEPLGAFLAHPRRSAVQGHVFLATDLEARQPVPDQEEFIDAAWYNIPTIEQNIRAGTFDNGHLLAAWNLFRLHRGELFDPS